VNPNIPAAGVPQGSSVYLNNGVPAQVTVAPNARQAPTGLDVKGSDFFMTLTGYGDDADPLGLTEKNALVLQSQQEVPREERQTRFIQRSAPFAPCLLRQPTAVSSGNGFKANSPVKFYLLPSTYIGELTTDDTGTYKGTLPIPVGVKAGSQTLQVNGFNAAGGVRSLSLGIKVVPASTVKVSTEKTQVYFDPMSPEISAAGRSSLNSLVKQVKKRGIRTVVLGFVQQAGTSANDQSLSTQRARNAAAYLRSRGLSGSYVVRGDGVAGPGDTDRRVNVTVRYNAGC
jgi:outer membrane protein OmpA-like peptidoglycan-associated protein